MQDVKQGMTQAVAMPQWNVSRSTLQKVIKNPHHSFHRPTILMKEAEAAQEMKTVTWPKKRGRPAMNLSKTAVPAKRTRRAMAKIYI